MAVARTPRRNAKKTQVDFMKGINNIGTPMALGVGLVGGKYLIKKLSTNKTVSGLLGTDTMKKYIIPGGVGLAGLLTPQVAKHKMIHMVGYGVATAGLEGVVESFTGKTLMGGLTSILSGNDDTNRISESTMATLRQAQQLPPADYSIDDDLEKSYEEPVTGTTDNLIDSDELGDSDEYDDEIGEADIEDVDAEIDQFSGDIPQ